HDKVVVLYAHAKMFCLKIDAGFYGEDFAGLQRLRRIAYVVHVHAQIVAERVYEEVLHSVLVPIRVARAQGALAKKLNCELMKIAQFHAGLVRRSSSRLSIQHELINLSLALCELSASRIGARDVRSVHGILCAYIADHQIARINLFMVLLVMKYGRIDSAAYDRRKAGS